MKDGSSVRRPVGIELSGVLGMKRMVTAIADAKAAATERGSPPGTKPAPPCRMGAWNSAFEKGEANCRSWRRSTASHTLTSKNLSTGPELSGVPARARKVERVLSCRVSSRAICALRAGVLARRSGPSQDATLSAAQAAFLDSSLPTTVPSSGTQPSSRTRSCAPAKEDSSWETPLVGTSSLHFSFCTIKPF